MKVAAAALAGALLVALACLAITPARHWTQEQAVCRGADYVGRGEKAVTAYGQDPGKYALICADRSGTVEAVGKASAVLGGVGVSLGLGLLGGALIGVPLARRRRTR